MRLRFVKPSAPGEEPRLMIATPGGGECVRRLERSALLPRELVQFAIEDTLDWRYGWFGRLATETSPDAAPESVTARQGAALAECLQAEQWAGPQPWAEFHRRLATACRERRVAVPSVDAVAVEQLRRSVREVGAAWRPLAAGGSLEREWVR